MKYATAVIIVVLVGVIAFSLLPREFLGKKPISNSTSTPVTTSTVVSTTVTSTQSGGSGNDLVLDIERNPLIKSPMVLTGKIRGTYMFEASFPIVVVDANGKQLGASHGQAKSDWMTTELVPFSADIKFSTSTTPTGYLILKNDNPSGLPQNDKSIKVPVRFPVPQGGGAGILPYDSGVKGQVTMGPSCGIQPLYPTDACKDKPYNTVVRVFRPDGSLFANMSTDASGSFSISLPPGEYDIVPKGGDMFPRCASQNVTVSPGRFETLNLSCDTGIR